MKEALPAAARSPALRRDNFRLAGSTDCMTGLRNWVPAFVAALFAFHSALFCALLSGMIGLGGYAAIHFGGCFAAAGLVARSRSPLTSNDRRAAALLIVASSMFAGPFGVIVAAALSIRREPIRTTGSSDNDADSQAYPPELERARYMHSSLLDRRIRLEGACGISPLSDVITEGTQLEKLEALGITYRRYESRLRGVLKQALRDPDNSVRVLAATITAKL